VDTNRFVPSPRDSTTRFQLGWTDRQVILTVGRLQKRKGHDQLIRALAILRRSLPKLLYVILGDGEERSELEALVKREGLAQHVQFRGEVDDSTLIPCYQQCDLFVLPNRQVAKDLEGFGMVLLEAQACGKPVIAGDSGGTAETMSIPETGLVVNCENPEALASVLYQLLQDPNRLSRMGQAARSWVLQRFDWQPLSHQAAEIFSRGHGVQEAQLIGQIASSPAR
jgi:phosphatidylinositol alpha-1,6-mannosyltransferase